MELRHCADSGGAQGSARQKASNRIGLEKDSNKACFCSYGVCQSRKNRVEMGLLSTDCSRWASTAQAPGALRSAPPPVRRQQPRAQAPALGRKSSSDSPRPLKVRPVHPITHRKKPRELRLCLKSKGQSPRPAMPWTSSFGSMTAAALDDLPLTHSHANPCSLQPAYGPHERHHAAIARSDAAKHAAGTNRIEMRVTGGC